MSKYTSTQPGATYAEGLEVNENLPEHAPEVHTPQQVLSPQTAHAYRMDPPYYTENAAKEYANNKPEQKILGLRRTTFWLLVVLIIVIIAAAIGGGVGGSIAVKNAKSNSTPNTPASNQEDNGEPTPTRSVSTDPSASGTASESGSTPTATSLTNESFSPLSIVQLDASCPENNTLSWDYPAGEPGTPPRNKHHDFACNSRTDYGGDGNNNVAIITAFTLQACVDACCMYNVLQQKEICTAAVLNPKLKDIYTKKGGNCFLKREAVNRTTNGDGAVGMAMINAGS